MAHYGGPTSPSRVHRPRAPIMSAPPPITAPLAPLRPPPPVTLVAPRPENERATNEYVETPFRQQLQQQTNANLQIPPPHPPRIQRPTRLPLPTPPQQQQQQQQQLQQQQQIQSHQLPITKQPTTASFSKDTIGNTTGIIIESGNVTTFTTTTGGHGGGGGGVVSGVGGRITTSTILSSSTTTPTTTTINAECIARPSIVCSECGRCRCESCQQPRPLPQRWICNNACLLSADSIIDYASCLCCVKGLFYHCSESDGGAGESSCADDPCSCNTEKRTARWGCLAALSFVLPCLWLYWPLRGCKRAVEACYARHSRTGCRCQPPIANTPEKRLLDTSPDF